MNVPDPASIIKAQGLAPDARDASGRSIYGGEETRQAIALLKAVGIPACVINVNALRYYGAGRVNWIFDSDRLYEPVKPPPPMQPPPPVPKSLRHMHPTFRLRGVSYYFILVPSSCCFIDPEMENCDLSKMGIPYPKHGSNIVDFIDGMNLDEKWGEENINFDDLQAKGIEFATPDLQAANVVQLNVGTDY
ncbi:hypothetical protein QQZ08_011193 [Neonectria magnoliae]|uniref:Uncharacterized protein n=1 Tax=Neonectria magnoliae TaxID=2732573 RepID=A0ABR1HCN3_9HYPO